MAIGRIALCSVKGMIKTREYEKEITGSGYIDLTDAVANKLLELKAYGGCVQRNLPEGYTQVNGVTGDGNNYIDLNTALTQDDEIELVFSYSNSMNSRQIFGYRNSASSNNITVFFAGTNDRLVIDFNNSDYTNYRLTADLSTNTIYTVKLSKTRRAVYQGSTLIAENTNVCNDTISITNTYLYNVAGSPAYASKFNGTIYSLKINGKRVMTSCTQSTDVGFYDEVSNSMFTLTNGTAGATTTPTPETPMDIVCNNGTIKVKDDELPVGYKRLLDISTTGNVRYISNIYLTGNDTLSFRFKAAPGNVIGAYNDANANDNFSFYNSTGSAASYARYNGQTGGSSTYTGTEYTVTISPTGVTGVRNPSSFTPTEFTCSIPLCVFATSPTGNVHSDATIYGSVEITGSQNLKLIPCERISDGAIGYYETYNGVFLENQENGTPTTSGYDTSHLTEIYYDGTVETIGVNGGTVTCENLLGVGDYVDEQEILSGNITRNVGIKVLDGTEDWSIQSTDYFSIKKTDIGTNSTVLPSNSTDKMLSTHNAVKSSGLRQEGDIWVGASYINFMLVATYTTTANWKQYLADQLAAGTPVIIVYPLAEPTTETVTGQTLSIPAGDSRIEITQASISGLGLYAKYLSTTE